MMAQKGGTPPHEMPPVPPRRPSEVIPNLPYYHPNLTNMNEVRQAMIPYVSQDGYFLLRNSFSKKGVHTVSVMHDRGIKHFNISKTVNTYYLLDKQFPSIDHLVRFHHHHDVPNLERVRGVRLSHPIKFVPEVSEPVLPREAAVKSKSQLLSPQSKHSRPAPAAPSEQYLSENGTDSGLNTAQERIALKKQISLDVPLPITKEKAAVQKTRSANQAGVSSKKGGFFSRFKAGKKSAEHTSKHAKLRCKSNSLEDRPPQPLPRTDDRNSNGRSASVSGTAETGYETIRDPAHDQLPELLSQLNLHGSMSRCDCGLYFDESELPCGWSIHLSHDKETQGRVFFMGPMNETSWNLPLEVCVELSSEQQEKIKQLLVDCNSHHPAVGSAVAEPGTVTVGGATAIAAGAAAVGSVDYRHVELPSGGPKDVRDHQGTAVSVGAAVALPETEDDDVFLPA